MVKCKASKGADTMEPGGALRTQGLSPKTHARAYLFLQLAVGLRSVIHFPELSFLHLLINAFQSVVLQTAVPRNLLKMQIAGPSSDH